MEIRAYSEDYLEYAQRNLGNMLDFAVNTLGIDADEFFDYFIKSGIAKQIQNIPSEKPGVKLPGM